MTENTGKRQVVNARPTMGIFGGYLTPEGKLLIKRRQPEEVTYVGDYDLFGGGAEEEEMKAAQNETVLWDILRRETVEEGNFDIGPCPDPMPAMYPAVVKFGADIAFMIVVETDKAPTKGEWLAVNSQEFIALCYAPKGQQVVSGYGKRMCRLGLKALTFSADEKSAIFAQRALREIQAM